MARIGELFFICASITTIATFFGFRALARKMVRSLGRKPEGRPPKDDDREAFDFYEDPAHREPGPREPQRKENT